MRKPKIVEPELTDNAKEIVKKRYLRSDMKGEVLETPGEMLWRVAYHMAKAEVEWGSNGVVMETARKFYERMVDWKLVCAGKAMFEAGNPGSTGQLSSCFVLPVEDSIDRIFKTLGEAAVVHKNNGGTGFNFSKIRPHGDKVRNVPDAASGPVDFLKAYSAALSQILQGAKRQGANIGILNADHPDIEEFINVKNKDGTIKNFNVSVGVTDEFMKAVEKDRDWELRNPRNKEVVETVKARELFGKIVKQAWKTGDPGLMFLDTVERGNTVPQFGRIDATNPCITGDSLVSTEIGLVRFDELFRRQKRGENIGVLVDKRVVGEKGVNSFVPEKVMCTGEKEVLEVETKYGYMLRLTSDHKLMTEGGWVEAGELNEGDSVLIQGGSGQFCSADELPFSWENTVKGENGRVYSFNLPIVWNKELGMFIGWLVGDGFIGKKKKKSGGYVAVSFGNQANGAYEYFKDLLSKWYEGTFERNPTERTRQIWMASGFVFEYFRDLGVLPVKSDKKRVPKSIYTAPKTVVVGFLRGLFGADGTVGYVKDKSSYVRLSSKSKDLLRDVQLLLLQFNIYSKIYDRSRPVRRNIFPEYVNSKGESVRYDSDGRLWELEISKESVLVFLDEIGFPFDLHKNKIDKLRDKGYYSVKFVDEIVRIERAGNEEVYDLVESRTRSLIANGLVVHNCGEVPLFPYESCNLTSLDLSRHMKKVKKSKVKSKKGEKAESQKLRVEDKNDERQETTWEIDWEDLEKSVRLGVRFLDNMIEVNEYPIAEIEETVKNGNRRIGLGVMGFAHLLYRLKVSYNSGKAVKLAKKLSKFIYETAADESAILAEERGSFPNWDLSIYTAQGQPMRNCAVCMVAPTGTTSMLVSASSGIEPVFSLVTKRRVFYENGKKNESAKELIIVDRVFEEYLEAKIKSKNEKVKIMKEVGRGDLSGLTKEERNIFVTTYEVEPRWHVKVQAAWQKYFDNSISKTINFSKRATKQDVWDAYTLAWKEGCKGITIYRNGSKQDQVLVSNSKNQTQNLEREEICPECGGRLGRGEGCVKCYDCGWSKCE